jgi:pimeloyl-ACP methyl ester carboxylesterase
MSDFSEPTSQADMLRREARALGELAALQRDPVFFGRGVPHGDGRLVLVLPGLFGNDLYLQPLHQWLRRIGYRPVRSTLMMNAGCPNRLRTQVEGGLSRQMKRTPGPVAIIGHSRGGMLGWAIASRLQADASHLLLLGSPAPAAVAMMRAGGSYIPAGMAASPVAAAGRRSLQLLDPDCNVPDCGCAYVEDIRRDLSPATRVMSIHSREDQIVPVDACRVPGGHNLEVDGTHSGLVYNAAVYPHVARFLALSDE